MIGNTPVDDLQNVPADALLVKLDLDDLDLGDFFAGCDGDRIGSDLVLPDDRINLIDELLSYLCWEDSGSGKILSSGSFSRIPYFSAGAAFRLLFLLHNKETDEFEIIHAGNPGLQC